MHKLYLFLLILMSHMIAKAQKDSTMQIEERDTLTRTDIIKGKPFAEWDGLEKQWNRQFLFPFLGKYKLKPSCAACSRFYSDVVFDVKKDGKFTVTFKNPDLCGKKWTDKMAKDFLIALHKFTFTEVFFNKVILIRLGAGLKC